MKKILASVATVAMVLPMVLNPAITKADTVNHFDMNNGISGSETIFKNPEEFMIEDGTALQITPRYIDYAGTVYEPSSRSSSATIKFNSEVINKSNTSDSVSRNVTRDKFVKGGVSTSADFGLITAKVGVKADIGFGKSSSVSTKYTWSIPARTKTTIKYGSKVYTTRGNIVRYDKGKVITRKPVDTKYTYSEYSSKVSKKIK